MCGRYVTVSKIQVIEKRFNVTAREPLKYVYNSNVSHGNFAPVITNQEPSQLQFFQFGFSPSWAKKQTYLVNARAEGDHNKTDDPQYTGGMGIIHKPMFKKAIRTQRCLIPADAFIEGPKKERLSKPYVVYLKEKQRPFAFAGIWEEWINAQTGEIVPTMAIITTVSNTVLQKIAHHRSPVILPKGAERDWLNTDLPLSAVTQYLKPYPAEEMNAYPVSSAIKNPAANGSDLLEPVGQRINPEWEFSLHQEIELFGMGESRARNRKKNEGGTQGTLF